MTSKRVNSGAALVLVLWLVAALSLVVLASAHGIRQQTQNIGFSLARMRAESVLDAAIQLAAQRMIAEKGLGTQYRIEQMTLGTNQVRLEITPSSGLVDVNVASDALLQALLQKVAGLAQGEAAILVSRIHDFIDPDDIPGGIGGAEAAQYRAAGWPSLPRNSALEDLSELKSVMGMTAALYETIAPYLGTNGQQGIEIGSAPPALIDALTGQQGLGARVHSSPLEMRAGELLSGAAAPFFTAASSAVGQTVRVQATLQAEDGRWWQRQAWLDLSARPDTLTPWTTLSLEPTHRVDGPEQEFKR
ncbi:MAG: general secretion pathway protein GspK [Simplicispira suum]|uniref:general secretion pathway protein GspK n=1 Tax=Simplicispira suum TaxID=2109915 RepID=UPI001C6CD6BE|nr:type II secretion system protein GspK [Simplicispira suum]MBW7831904.1 general secretion pathway protein GspK [Simplicispira suum]